jgi:4-hydroxy-tetrahydrodipicolinate synthase
LKELVELQISEGISGLVPCGTTGEASTMSREEQSRVIRTTVEQSRGRVPVIAGASANDTRVAVENSRMAKEAGADALLHATPYYNKPGAAGLLAHFREIASATDLPVVLYNVPGRTACDMQPDTVARLAALDRVVAIKEATGSIARAQQVIAACPDDFVVLSGDDATAMALAAVGGDGVISVISNIAPRLMADMIDSALKGQMEEARQINFRLLPLMELLFIESNPIPIKAAASLLGYGANSLRLPLVALEGEKLELLRAEMQRLGLLS